MDELRARAFLDLVLGQGLPAPPGRHGGPGRQRQHRQRQHRQRQHRQRQQAGGSGGSGSGGTAQQPPGAGPAGGAAGGFAGRVTLTVPLGTAAGLADRPGELGGHGPVDPWLARDLVNAAAASPKTTWCVTVTDQHGHAVGHGCARPEPKGTRKRAGPGRRRAGNRDGAGFSFTPASRDGPPGGYGTWRLRDTGRGAGPDRRDRLPGHRPVPAPVRGPGPRSRGQAAAPVPGPARDLHQPGVPATRPDLRFRAQHPVRGRRADVLVQRGPEVPVRPSAQAAARVDRRPVARRDVPVDHPGRAHLRHRTHPLPDLADAG